MLGLQYGETSDERARIGALAEALTPTADGLQFDAAHTPAQWMQGYAWAMVLDEERQQSSGSTTCPKNLNKRYTAPRNRVASPAGISADWPVFCWTADYGLFVAAQPSGSVMEVQHLQQRRPACTHEAAAGLLSTLGVLLAAGGGVLRLCSAGAGRGSCGPLPAGLDTIADGGTVRTAHHRLCRASWPTRLNRDQRAAAPPQGNHCPAGRRADRTGSPGSAMMCARRWR